MAAGGSRRRPNFLVHVNVLVAPVPRQAPRRCWPQAHVGRPPEVLRRTCAARRQEGVQAGSWPRCATSSGWSTARTRSPGPEQVLRYLSRYTHRVAISNRRLVAADDGGVSFRWKDYRIDGPGRWKTMTLTPHEFIRRFLMHVLPKGFHRIRHYGLFANGNRAERIAKARELLAVPPLANEPETAKAASADCRASVTSLPMLRRAHAHHRDLRTRLRAQVPAERDTADDQDRHLMMTSAWLDHQNAALARSWCSTSDAGACSDAANHPQSGMRYRRLNKSSKHPIAPIVPLLLADLSNWPRPAPSTAPSSEAKSP